MRTKLQISYEIQTLLNYVGGDFTFTPCIENKGHEVESIFLGEDCFAAKTSDGKFMFQKDFSTTKMLELELALHKGITINMLAAPYENMELFFCNRLADKYRGRYIKKSPLGTDDNYQSALDAYHEIAEEIEEDFPAFTKDDSDGDGYWYDFYIEDILPLFEQYFAEKNFNI